jgi:hypothetical protein
VPLVELLAFSFSVAFFLLEVGCVVLDVGIVVVFVYFLNFEALESLVDDAVLAEDEMLVLF